MEATQDRSIVSSPSQSSKLAKKLREFGLVVGGVFLAIGFWPMITGKELRFWATDIGAALFILGAAKPMLLEKPFEAWTKLGHALGWMNVRVVLAVVFLVLFTPVALVFRLFAKGFALKPDAGVESYFSVVSSDRECQFERIF